MEGGWQAPHPAAPGAGYIEAFTREQGYAPSLEEIAQHVGFSSVSNAHQHVGALIRRGYLRRDPNRSRSLEVVRHPEAAGELPMLGYVAAGEPIEVVEHHEPFSICPELLRRGDYVL